MIFGQILDPESFIYTYIVAKRPGDEALLIDPVLENTEQYVSLIDQLDLKSVIAADTHTHDDHMTAFSALRELTNCATAMGEMTKADSVFVRFSDNEKLRIDDTHLQILYTTGHTDDSYSVTQTCTDGTGGNFVNKNPVYWH